MKWTSLAIPTVAFSVACGPSIEPPPPCDDGLVCTREEDDDKRLTIVNATEEGKQIAYSFADQAQIDLDEAWDLSFERYIIRSDGGASGDGGVKVAVVDKELGDVTGTPDDADFKEDKDGTSGFRDDPRTVFLDDDPWYDYDLLNHTLAPKKRTYVVKTTSGASAAMQMVAYYDDKDEAGHPAFRWKLLP